MKKQLLAAYVWPTVTAGRRPHPNEDSCVARRWPWLTTSWNQFGGLVSEQCCTVVSTSCLKLREVPKLPDPGCQCTHMTVHSIPVAL